LSPPAADEKILKKSEKAEKVLQKYREITEKLDVAF
jgi:hypothetical protein